MSGFISLMIIIFMAYNSYVSLKDGDLLRLIYFMGFLIANVTFQGLKEIRDEIRKRNG